MNYRIVEVEQRSPDSLDGSVEIGAYDSAPRAVEAMRKALLGRELGALPNWYLVDSMGHLLAGPEDVLDVQG